MAKIAGFGMRQYVQGYDLSADSNSLTVATDQELYDVTGLDSSAVKRIIGMANGTVSFDGLFDDAAGKRHAIYSSNSGKLPTADQIILLPIDSSVGDPMVGFLAKQANYNVTRAGGSAIATSVEYSSNGYIPEWGVMLTSLQDTHSSATDGTAVDNSASTSAGGVGYLQVFSLGSGTVTVKVEDSADNVTYADLITFTNATGITAERATVSGTVDRYIRVSTSGTFTAAIIACGFGRY